MALRKQDYPLVNALWHFAFYCFVLSARSETDTLGHGQQLKDGEHLISAGRVFTLGFFTPGEKETVDYSNSERSFAQEDGAGYFNPVTPRNRFIGIWYTYDSSKKPVWVANRGKPISGTSGKLEIDKNGDLKISQHSSSLIILKSNQESARILGILTDSGNFVLREVNSDGLAGGKVMWQSFDYPTDILIPGMRLGFNFRTGKNWSLTSWVNDEVPAQGAFTLGADPNGTSQLILWRRGEIHWRSGIWHTGRFANLLDYLYQFECVSNKDERYFIFSAVNNWYVPFPMYQLNWDGEISTSDPSSESSRKGLRMNTHTLINCRNKYSEGTYIGCVEHKLPECRRRQWFDRSRGYVKSEGFKLDERKNILGVNDCEAECLNNCSCVAYAFIYPNGTGCELWSNLTQLLEDGRAGYRELYFQREGRLEGNQGRKKLWWIWLIVATAGTLFLILLVWIGYRVQRTLLLVIRFFWMLGYFILRSLKANLQKLDRHVQQSLEAGTRQMEQMSLTDLGSSSGYSVKLLRNKKVRTMAKKSHGIKVFSFESMVKATDNFSFSNRLGQGGFGIVYKGMLEDGHEIAIKRLSRTSKQGRLEFTNEVKLVAKLQHTNLVGLIGCCTEQGEKIVVYEYMKNKSLDYFLFDSSRKAILTWKKRLNIIDGVAQGLLYLHKYSRLKIIHRDLKSGNILLDEEMNPKISDFGMARIFEQNKSQAKTGRVVGTPGYMSPEYRIDGYFSIKSDVFSFGVLLLEIITTKKNHGSYCSDRPLNLVGYAWELWIGNRGSELIDQTLNLSSFDHAEAIRCINVGLLCTQEHPADRPTMSTVVAMIHSESSQLPRPKKPAFFIGDGLPHTEHPRDLENATLNDASISEMEAR